MAILAGDIGATKTILAIYDSHGQLAKKRFASKGYRSFYAMLREFLTGRKVTRACFGAPGPVINGSVKATHLRWTLNEHKLRKMLGCPVKLINDVEAMARGLTHLRARDTVLLFGKHSTGTKALLAPGTGLGMAFLTPHEVIASEGGHADFAPMNELELKFKTFLRKKLAYAGTEAVLSGPGLLNIHEFLTHKRLDSPAMVTDGASRNDKRCIKTVTLFLRVLAHETQRVALTSKALGGVYIAGGVVRHLLPFLKKNTFAKYYLDNPRMRRLLALIPVYVVLNDELGLLGALSCARTGLFSASSRR